MESNKIETLIEKYFEAKTSIIEEKELRSYFSQPNVAPHLEQYKPLFTYYPEAQKLEFTPSVLLPTKKRKVIWLSIAASTVVLLGSLWFFVNNTNQNQVSEQLISQQDPKKMFEETQRALALLSTNVNVGIESVQYVQEYENARKQVFKK